jgi:PPK2 family polyphosphate:nucleotide phosphotransferase
MNIRDFLIPRSGKKFSLRKLNADSTDGVRDEKQGVAMLEKCRADLAEMQDKLYAQDKWAVLVVLQAMDAAGKDSTIKFVMSGVNPQGCQVVSFKEPSHEELDHDFMWRYMKNMPERGRIGIFNRSYYEEVLVVRVHPQLLDKQSLPDPCKKDVWERRFADINAVERYLVNNGVVPIKIFLNVSKGAQLKRLLKRLDKPNKNWKFAESDIAERALWDDYMDAYESMLQNTSTEHAPWYVVPADNKWYTRVAVAEIITQRMAELDVKYPAVSKERQLTLRRLRRKLAGV